jgi:hypothetical protein
MQIFGNSEQCYETRFSSETISIEAKAYKNNSKFQHIQEKDVTMETSWILLEG